MGLANLDLYQALKAAGVNEELATKAAESVYGVPAIDKLNERFDGLEKRIEAMDHRLIRVESGLEHLTKVVYGAVLGILLLLLRGFWPA